MWASFTWWLWRARKSNILRLILHTLWYAKKVLCESLSLSLIQTHQITSISLQILAYFTVAHVSWFSTTYMKPEVALNRSHLCKLLLNVISSYHRHFMNVKNVVHFVLPSLSLTFTLPSPLLLLLLWHRFYVAHTSLNMLFVWNPTQNGRITWRWSDQPRINKGANFRKYSIAQGSFTIG